MWPGFLLAVANEILVFAFVDPADLHWAGEAVAWSRSTVCSIAFFAFWLFGMGACALTLLLEATPDSLNRAADEGR